MFSLDETGDRVAIGHMNAELRNAQLEMLSAQCATDRLRVRYSPKDIAHHAHRDTLRKAWASANALFEYYGAIVKQMPDSDAREKSLGSPPGEAKVLETRDRMVRFLGEQQERFRPLSLPVGDDHRLAMLPFFSATLLEKVRLVKLDPQRLPQPLFLSEPQTLSITNLRELTHMSSFTFDDVVLFHGQIAVRNLFHALVHAVQFEVLGLEQYAELFVRGFFRTRSHVNVPLEVHACMLEFAFAEGPAQPFSVEEKVRIWANQGRYSPI